MSGSWNDFNDAKQNSNIIPKGTLAKVRLTIRPGGFDDPAQGWTGGYATRGTTGSVYLSGEFTVLEGPYARRKIFTLIGLYSPKGPDWANMGRSLIRGMLNSARGISDKDSSAQAQAARRISGFADLDGLEFVARIDVGTDTNGEEKNETLLHGSLEQDVDLNGRECTGEAPTKDCPECGAVVPLATTECPLCGHHWEREHTGEATPLGEFVMSEIDLLKRSSFRWCDLFGDDAALIASGFNAWGGVFFLNGRWYGIGGVQKQRPHLLAAGERTVCLAAADDWLAICSSSSARAAGMSVCMSATTPQPSMFSAAINPIASRSPGCRATGSWRCAARPIAPSPRTSDRAFQARLADEIQSLPPGAALERAMLDYARLRDQVRACMHGRTSDRR